MNLRIRGSDQWGSGKYYASRGGRHHNGLDIVVKPGQQIRPLTGGKVSKIGFPYDPQDDSKGYLRYIQIMDSNGFELRYFYLAPSVTVTQYVTINSVIGFAEDLTKIYPGITNHYHFEVLTFLNDQKVFINPVHYLRAVGHEFDGST